MRFMESKKLGTGNRGMFVIATILGIAGLVLLSLAGS